MAAGNIISDDRGICRLDRQKIACVLVVQDLRSSLELRLCPMQVGDPIEILRLFRQLGNLRPHLHQLALDYEVFVNGGAAHWQAALKCYVTRDVLLAARVQRLHRCLILTFEQRMHLLRLALDMQPLLGWLRLHLSVYDFALLCLSDEWRQI
jgi:hypothetical protein